MCKKGMMDESHIKSIEEELVNKTEELQNMQSQIIKQEKMATIGYLAAGVAHEINNPLGFISSNFESLSKYIEVFKAVIDRYSKLEGAMKALSKEEIIENITEVTKLKDEKDVNFIYEDIDNLMDECNEGMERIRTIVKGLRLFSYEAIEEKFEQYDLNNGIKNTLIIAKNEVKYNANINLNLGNIPSIEAIGGQINQVLLNIIVNASHAIKEKGENTLGNITISTYSDEKYVYCSVEDDGIGISKENLARIFKNFFTTKPQGKGTGLGLPISYSIIKQQHDGDISVDSVQGKGTKFIIKLPIKQLQKKGN